MSIAKTATLYFCGGAGGNIGKQFIPFSGIKENEFCLVRACFIDTSESNIFNVPSINQDDVYLLEGADGSGKIKKTNYESLAEKVPEILHKLQPSDLNVIIHSCGGGSGSTIGGLLVSALLARGKTVVAVIIGSSGDALEIQNVIGTIKSYENISRLRGKPVIAAYHENSPTTKRNTINDDVSTQIIYLTALFSGNNEGLDSADLSNFLDYTKVTNIPPRLAMLRIYSKEIVLGKDESLITVATLTDSDAEGYLDGHLVRYQVSGIISDMGTSIKVSLPIHSCIINNAFNVVVKTLEDKLEDHKVAESMVVIKPILGDDHTATAAGLIL